MSEVMDKVSFSDLALGARFTYEPDSDEQWVKIGAIQAALWCGDEAHSSVVSSFDEDDDVSQGVYLVPYVATPIARAAPDTAEELAQAHGRIADLEAQLSAERSVTGLQVGWAAIRNGKVNNLSQNKPAHPGKDGWEYWAEKGFTEPFPLLLGTPELSKATLAGLLERARQIGTEGWTPDSDDQYTDGQLARAAACYAMSAANIGNLYIRNHWPWDWKWFKPTNPYRDLEKSFALVLAEMERRDRIASESTG